MQIYKKIKHTRASSVSYNNIFLRRSQVWLRHSANWMPVEIEHSVWIVYQRSRKKTNLSDLSLARFLLFVILVTLMLSEAIEKIYYAGWLNVVKNKRKCVQLWYIQVNWHWYLLTGLVYPSNIYHVHAVYHCNNPSSLSISKTFLDDSR